MSKQELPAGVNITYGEENGGVYFVYGKNCLRIPVPEDTREKGMEAIQEYAEKHVLEDLRKREKLRR